MPHGLQADRFHFTDHSPERIARIPLNPEEECVGERADYVLKVCLVATSHRRCDHNVVLIDHSTDENGPDGQQKHVNRDPLASSEFRQPQDKMIFQGKIRSRAGMTRLLSPGAICRNLKRFESPGEPFLPKG